MREEINFLPGPVAIYPECLKALAGAPYSHRSARFERLAASAEALLCRLTRARCCTFMMGSGTLANEAVAAQLSLLKGKGLIAANGEFGERLMDQAARFRLDFERLNFPWGAPLDYDAAEARLKGKKWLWFVHCETSTGVLNDLERLTAACARRGALLCVDAISSIGCVPLDLSAACLASGASGKGLGALPGVAFVLSRRSPALSAEIPKYLDLGHYRHRELVPFTFSSNLVEALKAGAARTLKRPRQAEAKKAGDRIRAFLRARGVPLAGDGCVVAEHIITLSPGAAFSSKRLGEFLEKKGILTHYRNPYLLQRNWLQIALMGNVPPAGAEKLIAAMDSFLRGGGKLPAKILYNNFRRTL